MTTTYTMTTAIYDEKIRVANLPTIDAAVEAWAARRDESGAGASDCDPVVVKQGSKVVARIAYNGRIFPA